MCLDVKDFPMFFRPGTGSSGALLGALGQASAWRHALRILRGPFMTITRIMGFYSGLMGFIVIQWDINGIYPLVICYIAIEHGHL